MQPGAATAPRLGPGMIPTKEAASDGIFARPPVSRGTAEGGQERHDETRGPKGCEALRGRTRMHADKDTVALTRG